MSNINYYFVLCVSRDEVTIANLIPMNSQAICLIPFCLNKNDDFRNVCLQHLPTLCDQPPSLLISASYFSFFCVWNLSPPSNLPGQCPESPIFPASFSSKYTRHAFSAFRACLPLRSCSIIWESDRPGF